MSLINEQKSILMKEWQSIKKNLNTLNLGDKNREKIKKLQTFNITYFLGQNFLVMMNCKIT